MNQTLTADPHVGHFDRRETLEHLLESYTPPQPEAVTIEEYRAWKPAQRRQFNDCRCERIAGNIVIQTPTIQELNVEYRRASLFADRPIGRTGLILSGPPTMGKTTAAFQTMLRAFERHIERFPDWKVRGHVPIVYVELPSKCNGKNLMGRFLQFFGAPVTPRMTLEERTQLVTELLTKSHTVLVVVDEMQNLLTNTGRFESAQAMKNLMNSIKAVPLYVGINLDKSALTNTDLGAQFAARCSLVRLDKLSVATAEGRRLWGGVIVGFERQFALMNHPERTLIPEAMYLWNRTRGSVAALSRLLTIAALDLIDAGDPSAETITKMQLDSIKLDLTTERELDLSASQKGDRRAA